MKKSLIILLSLAFALAQSCTKSEAQYEQIDSPGAVDKISVSLEPARDIDATKSEINEDGLFVWSEGDTLAVYPSVGSQVYFVLETGGGETSATFDGGGWALKNDIDYYSYYPFQGNIYLPKDKIPVSYLGQTHTGTIGSKDIGKYDFRYTEKSRSEDGTLSFNYKMLNTVIRFTVTLPVGTYDKLTISSDDAIFTTEGYYDLTAETPAIVTTKTAKSLSVELKDITLTEQTQFKVYMMTAPIAIKDKEVTISVRNSEGKVLSLKKTPSHDYEAGEINGLSCYDWSEPEGMEYVDLGLSVKWATCNLGASSPEEYGDYYAWGYIEPYYEEGDAPWSGGEQPQRHWKAGMESGYSIENYKYYRAGTTFDGDFTREIWGYTKYVPQSQAEAYGWEGFYDNKTALDSEEDAAHCLLGGKWRMPTADEVSELIRTCQWEWVTYKGVKGQKVTGTKPGYTDKWIFLPAAGIYDATSFDNTQIHSFGYAGYYSSLSLIMSSSDGAAHCIQFYEQSVSYYGVRDRASGCSIRPVCE